MEAKQRNHVELGRQPISTGPLRTSPPDGSAVSLAGFCGGEIPDGGLLGEHKFPRSHGSPIRSSMVVAHESLLFNPSAIESHHRTAADIQSITLDIDNDDSQLTEDDRQNWRTSDHNYIDVVGGPRYVMSTVKSCCASESGIIAGDLNFQLITDERYGKGQRAWKNLSSSEQVWLIRHALRQRSFLLDPGSLYMRTWSLLVAICLVYTAILTPYELAFLRRRFSAVYVVSRFVDLIFVKDMILNFFLRVQRVDEARRKVWLRTHREVVTVYLRGWFLIDLVSSIPYSELTFLLSGAPDTGQRQPWSVTFIGLLRLVRLFKLVQVSKVALLRHLWRNYVSTSANVTRLLKFCLVLVATCHWMACIWGYVGINEGSNLICRDTMDLNEPLPDGVSEDEGQNFFLRRPSAWHPHDTSAWEGESWIVVFAATRAANSPSDPCSEFVLYAISMYWSTMTLTSIGFGDIVPVSPLEYWVCNIAMLISSCIWAYIIGAICTLVYSMDHEQLDFDDRMDSFNRLAKENKLPVSLCHRVRDFLRESRSHRKYVKSMETTKSLTSALRGTIAEHMAMQYLGRIPLFKNTGPPFRQAIAGLLKPHFFERQEKIPFAASICVVQRGLVLLGGEVVMQNGFWGDDMVLGNEGLRHYFSAKCLTHTELLTLDRGHFFRVLKKYPEEGKVIRKVIACLAFRRVIQVFCRERRSGHYLPEWTWIHTLLDPASLIAATTGTSSC